MNKSIEFIKWLECKALSEGWKVSMMFEIFQTPIYLSVPSVAELLGQTNQNVYEQVKKKHIPSEVDQFGGQNRYRVPADKFKNWLRNELIKQERKVLFLRESSKKLEELIKNG